MTEPQAPQLTAGAISALVATLRANGYIVYPKPPRRRGDTVKLPNGTILVQTRVEEPTP